MMHRRVFLKSLAAMTAGILLSDPLLGAESSGSDRLGDLLPLRRLGKTGKQVTMLGLGGWHVGRMDERMAQATIEAAIESGVRFFDNAESYAQNGAEIKYGQFLTPKYRDDIFLMTKTLSHDAATARAHLEGSLKRLKTDYIDLWQLHSLESAEDVDHRLARGVLDVMLEAKEQGKVRHIGFTGHRDPAAHTRMLELIDAFETCQMPINLIDPSYNSFIDRVLPTTLDREMGVLAMKTLSNGRFFTGPSRGMDKGKVEPIIPNRVSLEQALGFVWSLPVSTIIIGPDNPQQLRTDAALARRFTGMDESQRLDLVRKVADLAGSGVEYYKA